MANEWLTNGEDRMKKAVANLTKELATLRAGRANPALLEKIQIDYYGAPTPLNQIAGISVPEARLLVVQPYDKSIIDEIEKAILKSDLGLTPSNDGDVIRITIPPLTEERRAELVKLVKKYAEENKVAVRNVRRDVNDDLKKSEKNGEITEDELRRLTDEVQKLTDKYIAQIDKIVEEKEKEIMEV